MGSLSDYCYMCSKKLPEDYLAGTCEGCSKLEILFSHLENLSEKGYTVLGGVSQSSYIIIDSEMAKLLLEYIHKCKDKGY